MVQTEHGSLEVSPSPAAAGSRVTVTVTPDEGYEPGTLTVTDRSGNAVSVEDNGDGTFTFVMPAGGVEVEAIFVPACKRDETCPLAKFTDAAPTAWYHDGVHYCVEHGLMVGTSAIQGLLQDQLRAMTGRDMRVVFADKGEAPAAKPDMDKLNALSRFGNIKFE